MNKMSRTSRLILAIAALSLIITYFVPVWAIYLTAPQYPEGLAMYIWLTKLSGEVEIINGLNHYIGMKHISVEMFPEFKYLVYIVGFFIAFGLLVALTGSRKLLLANIGLNIFGACAALYDFYRWGYDYGHNLDPAAAIKVPGLSYQPPVIGHKQLLNFDAYSYPDVGAWIVIGGGLLQILIFFLEWRKQKRAKDVNATKGQVFKPAAATIAACLMLTLISCSSGPQPFAYGKDQCDDCKMTIMEPNFGAQVITKKGRVYKFDDAHCVANFLTKQKIAEADVAQTVFSEYDNNKNFVDASETFFVVSPQLNSPMNSNAAAFATKAAADATAAKTGGSIKRWSELKVSL